MIQITEIAAPLLNFVTQDWQVFLAAIMGIVYGGVYMKLVHTINAVLAFVGTVAMIAAFYGVLLTIDQFLATPGTGFGRAIALFTCIPVFCGAYWVTRYALPDALADSWVFPWWLWSVFVIIAATYAEGLAIRGGTLPAVWFYLGVPLVGGALLERVFWQWFKGYLLRLDEKIKMVEN